MALDVALAGGKAAGVREIIDGETVHPPEDGVVGEIVRDQTIEFGGILPDGRGPGNKGFAEDGLERAQDGIFIDTGITLDGDTRGAT